MGTLPLNNLRESFRVNRAGLVCSGYKKGLVALEKENTLTETLAQVDRAERIRLPVAREFDPIAEAFQAQATIQTATGQAETRTILAILEPKRVETLANLHAGYFIREWQERGDQIRQMIATDPRFVVNGDQRAAPRREAFERRYVELPMKNNRE